MQIIFAPHTFTCCRQVCVF